MLDLGAYLLQKLFLIPFRETLFKVSNGPLVLLCQATLRIAAQEKAF